MIKNEGSGFFLVLLTDSNFCCLFPSMLDTEFYAEHLSNQKIYLLKKWISTLKKPSYF